MPTYNVTDGEHQSLVLAPQTPDEIDNINASDSSIVSISETNGRSYPATVNVNLAPNAQVTLSYKAFNTNFLHVTAIPRQP